MLKINRKYLKLMFLECHFSNRLSHLKNGTDVNFDSLLLYMVVPYESKNQLNLNFYSEELFLFAVCVKISPIFKALFFLY